MNVLVGNAPKSACPFYVFKCTGLSTSDAGLAREHQLSGFEMKTVNVDQITLKDILIANVGDREIHFLKVDAEGAEADVLKSNDWSRFRPWICVVEATKPLSSEESHQEWEGILTSNGYLHVYSDGLNRFYLREESRDIEQAFAYPPNVFDQYVTSEVLELKEKLASYQRSNLLGNKAVAKGRKSALSSVWRTIRSYWRQ